MIAYFNGDYLSFDEICISPGDRGFLFADGLYEVVRSYKGRLFRVKDHLDRLSYGAQSLGFRQTDFSFLEKAAVRLIRENGLEEADSIVYFQVTRGCAVKRTHAFPDPVPDLTIFGRVSGLDTETLTKDMIYGVDIITIEDMRGSICDIKTTGLLCNVLASQQAKEHGVKEAVFVREDTVLEGTHSNFFAVINNTVVTPQLSRQILGGITRKVVLETCRNIGIPVQERTIQRSELIIATEIFVTATSLQVTPVVSCDQNQVGKGRPGPITLQIQKLFEDEI